MTHKDVKDRREDRTKDKIREQRYLLPLQVSIYVGGLNNLRASSPRRRASTGVSAGHKRMERIVKFFSQMYRMHVVGNNKL